MKDRIPTSGQEGRVQFTIESQSGNVIIGNLEMADNPSEVGTALNKANLLSDQTAAKYNYSAGVEPTPNLTFDILSNAPTWHLIQEYTTAGTYTYTIPTGISELGICMIGGGGGAPAARYINSIWASGGASGQVKSFILDVSGLSSIPIVIGSGGIGGSIVRDTTNIAGANGNNGGSTSVNGITCSGGEGGKYMSGSSWNNISAGVVPAKGGQGAYIPMSSDWQAVYVAGATPAVCIMRSGSLAVLTGTCLNTPAQSINPFENDYSSARKFLLSAGAGIGQDIANYTAYAPNLALPNIKGGDSLSRTPPSDTRTTISGGNATGYGNGGGAVSLQGSTSYTYYPPLQGGNGSDGAVFIYAR